MDRIIIWAPLAFGAMIGWIAVYFIRKYKKFDGKILWKTSGVFLGGVGLDSIGFILGSKYGVYCIMYYLLGCSIGFFAHWIYQFIISIISREGRKSLMDYSLLSSCNISEEEELRLMGNMAKENTINQSESSKVVISKES